MADPTHRNALLDDLFRGAMEASLDAFMFLSPVVDEVGAIQDWIIEYVNDQARHIYSLGKLEVVGHSVSSLWGDDALTVSDFLDVYAQLRVDGSPVEGIFEIRINDELRIWVRRKVARVGDCVAITSRDVTAEHLQAEALRLSQSMYQMFIENAAEGVWALDTERRTTFVNERMAAMLGYTVDEMLGRHVDDFTAPADREFAANRFAMMRGGLSDTYDRPFVHRDGSIVWVELSTTLIRDDAGEFVGSFGFATDQSRRHAAEDALRESEERYRTIVENSREGILACDRDGHILVANSTAERMFGRTQADLVGRPIRDLFSDRETDTAADEFRKTVRAGKEYVNRSEIELTRPDASTLWVDISTVTFADSSRPGGGIMVAMSDTSDRHAAEQTRSELSARLEQAEMQQRSNLASDLHDGPIQTLAAVAIRAGALRRELEECGADTTVVVAVERDVLTTLRELRTLLFELVVPDPEQGGLGRALEALAELVAGSNGLQFRVDDRGTAISQDRAAVLLRIAREALANVVRHAAAQSVLVVLEQHVHEVCLTITDDGVGFDTRSSLVSPGHYGLTAIVERARAAGGTCIVESSPGVGTAVRTMIPVAG